MKKFYSYVAILAISSMAFLTSCSKNDDEVPNTATPDVTLPLNENTQKTDVRTIYVKRDQLSATLQVTAVSKTTTDMKRVYVYKKSTSTSGGVGSYTTVEGSGFKKDGNNDFYYDIPNDQRNNAVITLTVTLNANNTAAVVDEYYFAFTSANTFNGPATANGLLVGPAQIYIQYGVLTETTGYRLNNIQGPNSGAFDLVALTNRNASDPATGKDMIDADASTATWDKSFSAGTSGTLYSKISSSFDYANATDISIKAAYANADNATGTVTNVAAGNLYVAKLRGLDQYALIKVTFISDETGATGAGNNNEYMEFSVKK